LPRRQFGDRVSNNYLKRLGTGDYGYYTAIHRGPCTVCGAHLLDSGFSTAFLDEWVKRQWATSTSLRDLLDEGNSLLRKAMRSDRCAIRFETPEPGCWEPANWVTPQKASEWLTSRSSPSPSMGAAHARHRRGSRSMGCRPRGAGTLRKDHCESPGRIANHTTAHSPPDVGSGTP
jgi:hypothetical protein